MIQPILTAWKYAERNKQTQKRLFTIISRGFINPIDSKYRTLEPTWSIVIECVIRRELTLWKGCVIVAIQGHSQHCEWPSWARITQPFYSIKF